jgi:hypothetical protein
MKVSFEMPWETAGIAFRTALQERRGRNSWTVNKGGSCIHNNVGHFHYVEIKCQLDAADDFYCRSYCFLNMFQAPLCPSSGAREYYIDGCCLWSLVLWFSSCRYGVELRVVCPVCESRAAPHHTDNLKTKAPKTTGGNQLYNTLELLMMGKMVPETCWASNKICNKNHLSHLVGILFPHIIDDARSKSLQTSTMFCKLS